MTAEFPRQRAQNYIPRAKEIVEREYADAPPLPKSNEQWSQGLLDK